MSQDDALNNHPVRQCSSCEFFDSSETRPGPTGLYLCRRYPSREWKSLHDWCGEWRLSSRIKTGSTQRPTTPPDKSVRPR